MAKEPWHSLATELRVVDPRLLQPREVNARYMAPEEFGRLCENIRIDGKLTSAILVCENPDGSLEVLSGHHRRAAAIEVGIPLVDVIVITTPLSEERKKAIQLSHNAVNGKDDPSVLAELYRGLSLDAKLFSGLTDEVLDFDALTIGGIGADIRYEEMRLIFVPEDRAAFEAAVETIKRTKNVASTHLARFADFDAIFGAVLEVKERKNVLNSALAFLVMAELAMERLLELGDEVAPAETNPQYMFASEG